MFKTNLRDYFTLCKPKVVLLILFTALVGMLLSSQSLPDIATIFFGMTGIALAAASGAAFNHVVDSEIDKRMLRTIKRPLAKGSIKSKHAIYFASGLAISSILILVIYINTLTALLALASLIGYALIYSVFLKRATPQNIVLGGVAGAAPPVLGWTANTGEIHGDALLLFLIIFIWTPPHFWALAIDRKEDYAKANIPMLPVTHDIKFTKLHITLYTVLLFIITLLPFLTRMSGILYFIAALLLGGEFIRQSIRLYLQPDHKSALSTFKYSITYLSLLFAFLLLDHYLITL